MRDYAELVKSLRYYGAFEQHAKDAADAIEELLAENKAIKQSNKDAAMRNKLLCDEISRMKEKVPHWISVEEALPKNAGQMCLVCAKNSFGQQSVFNAFTGYGDFNWYTYDTTKMRSRLDNNNAIALGWEITHWMPLPKPPKEVQDGRHSDL